MMEQYRPVLKAFYPVAGLLALTSVAQPALQILPLRFGDVTWRFGATGLMSGALTGMLVGLGAALLVAAALGHRRTVRALSVLSMLGALVLAVVFVLFSLDFLQVRTSVNPQFRSGLDATVLRALLIMAVSIPVAMALGITGWRSARAVQAVSHKAPDRGAGLVLQSATRATGGKGS